MTQSGSYNVASFATSTQAEIRRLNAQVDLFWTTEFTLLQRYGLSDGMDILDCGCGPGRLIELLKGRLPKLRCTGLEMDPLLVEAASALIVKRGLEACRIVQGTAEQPGLDEASFDFIILRLVLEHVPDPVLALGSLSRLLRLGGRLVIISNDFEFHLQTWPPVPQLDRLYEAYRSSRRRDGGDPCIGRKLPRLLTQADLHVVGYEVEVAHNAVLGDKPFLKAEGAGIPAQLVQSGFLDGKTLEEMTRSWRSMLAEPNHSIVRPLFVCIGKRTAETEQLLSGNIPVKEKMKAPATGKLTVSQAEIAEKPGEYLTLIFSLVAQVLEEKLQTLGKKIVEPEDLLADLGMDSLAALDLQEKIIDCTGVEITLEKLLENMSVINLAKYVEEESARKGLKVKTSNIPREEQESVRWEEGEI
jgi:ubiquinone/menaquinone biosynthesis C-methylase UbiE/acyl carrier protein